MGSKGFASCLVLLLVGSSGVLALPRVVGQGDGKSNVQVHYNITSAKLGLAPTDDDGFVDFESHGAPGLGNDRKPGFCSDCVCGGTSRKTRIVGGGVSGSREFPWVVIIRRENVYHCAGTLITRRHVVTAAHCLKNSVEGDFIIVPGETNRASDRPGVEHKVKTIYSHERFNPYDFNNDIAVMELETPVQLSSTVQTLCLPDNQYVDYTGRMATAVGWGRTEEDGILSSQLLKVDVPILSQEECDRSGYAEHRVTENMFCAGYLDGGRDACRGDSGGPLQVLGPNGHYEFAGIISWGRGCARPRFPGVYAKMTNYLGWLKDRLQGECVCHPVP
ncbi:trypsin 3A1 [Orussus abietinus]|uniref:trypsin 3A1 n=1 Tax=Orussus abietinus TaxID=222816 RepID=UPI000625A989|nr:trypsin 3A1 [Orussus abietinus]